MERIPFKKRILFYLALLPISSMAFGLSMILTIIISGNRESGMITYVIAFLIMNYVFGIIFLKTKRTLKFILPFVMALVSYTLFWLMFEYEFYFETNFVYFDFFIQMALIVDCPWEITYQIIKRKNIKQQCKK